MMERVVFGLMMDCKLDSDDDWDEEVLGWAI